MSHIISQGDQFRIGAYTKMRGDWGSKADDIGDQGISIESKSTKKVVDLLAVMGVCVSKERMNGVSPTKRAKNSKVIKIRHAGGYVDEFDRPVRTQEVMKLYARHWVTRPDVFKAARSHLSVLPPQALLTPGHTYFLVPFRTLYQRSLRQAISKPDLLAFLTQQGLSPAEFHRHLKVKPYPVPKYHRLTRVAGRTKRIKALAHHNHQQSRAPDAPVNHDLLLIDYISDAHQEKTPFHHNLLPLHDANHRKSAPAGPDLPLHVDHNHAASASIDHNLLKLTPTHGVNQKKRLKVLSDYISNHSLNLTNHVSSVANHHQKVLLLSDYVSSHSLNHISSGVNHHLNTTDQKRALVNLNYDQISHNHGVNSQKKASKARGRPISFHDGVQSHCENASYGNVHCNMDVNMGTSSNLEKNGSIAPISDKQHQIVQHSTKLESLTGLPHLKANPQSPPRNHTTMLIDADHPLDGALQQSTLRVHHHHPRRLHLHRHPHQQQDSTNGKQNDAKTSKNAMSIITPEATITHVAADIVEPGQTEEHVVVPASKPPKVQESNQQGKGRNCTTSLDQSTETLLCGNQDTLKATIKPVANMIAPPSEPEKSEALTLQCFPDERPPSLQPPLLLRSRSVQDHSEMQRTNHVNQLIMNFESNQSDVINKNDNLQNLLSKTQQSGKSRKLSSFVGEIELKPDVVCKKPWSLRELMTLSPLLMIRRDSDCSSDEIADRDSTQDLHNRPQFNSIAPEGRGRRRNTPPYETHDVLVEDQDRHKSSNVPDNCQEKTDANHDLNRVVEGILPPPSADKCLTEICNSQQMMRLHMIQRIRHRRGRFKSHSRWKPSLQPVYEYASD